MKNTTKIFTLLLFVMLSFVSKAQSIQTNGVSNLNTCDGSAYFTDSNYYSSWTWYDQNQSIFQQGGGSVYNLCYGSYSLICLDSLGGSNTYSFFIDTLTNNPCSYFDFILGTTYSSPNACTGTAQLNINTLYPNNTSVLWSNGLTLGYAYDLCPGNYSVTVIDGNGCSETQSFVIMDSSSINPCSNFWSYLSPAASYDSLCNGSASVAAYGGDGNYSFLWSTNETSYQISNLCPGNYSVTVTDGNGCIYDQYFTIYDSISGCNMQIYADSVIQLSNPNSCDAYAHVSVYGGNGNYTYNWSNGLLGTNEMYNLCAGTYIVTAVDGNGCSASTSITIYADTTSSNCQNFYAYVIQSSPSSNINSCDGTATIMISGGSGLYSIIWDNILGTETASNLCYGYHTVNIYDDSLGCNYSLSVLIYGDSINQNYSLDAYVYTYEPSAEGQCDGSAYVEVWGGTAPYTFEHSNGQVTQYATNLCAGIYSVYVTDANGDSLLLNYIVPESNNIFNGGGFNDSTIVDTLYNDLIEDCLLDYLTLDTAYISNIEYIGLDSILVTWSVIDGNGTSTFLQSYTISTGVGVYELILQIFCPQRSGTDYVYAIDQIYYNPALAKVNEIKDIEFSVYPNPFENNIHIDLEENLNSSIIIRDVTGKLIYSSDFATKSIDINLENLAQGHYFLSVLNAKTNKTQIISK